MSGLDYLARMPDLRSFERSSADLLRLVIEEGHIGIWELDVATGHAVRNRRHDEIFGYAEPLDEWTYDQFLSHVIDVDRERVDAMQKTAIDNGKEWKFDCRIKRVDGEQRWITATGKPLRNGRGEVDRMIGHVIDITENKERESRLELVTAELNHRVRNILAMIKAMVRLSGNRATDVAAFTKSLEGRVGALARSYDLLMGDDTTGLTPRELLETEISVFPTLDQRITIESGDEPRLAGSAGQGLALVFHELITNAIKYGAFSNDAGSVEVSIAPGDKDGSTFRVSWKERGGPEVANPSSSGFGSTLIASALGSHGTVDLRYAAGGVECVIELHAAGSLSPTSSERC